MGENSAIEWTTHTFNPWVGCTQISPGCDNCYAKEFANRFWRAEKLWEGNRRRTSAANWQKPITWNRKAAASGTRASVFCASLADVFDNQVDAEWRADLWQLIAATPHLDWQLLTKRPQNIRKMLPAGWDDGWPNVWLGVTVEDRKRAQERLPALGVIPAAVRFISAEPLIEDWADMLLDAVADWRFEWVICGGESGHGARPMSMEMARRLRNTTKQSGAAFFFKQTGSNRPGWPAGITGDGDNLTQLPAEFRIREFPAIHDADCGFGRLRATGITGNEDGQPSLPF